MHLPNYIPYTINIVRKMRFYIKYDFNNALCIQLFAFIYVLTQMYLFVHVNKQNKIL